LPDKPAAQPLRPFLGAGPHSGSGNELGKELAADSARIRDPARDTFRQAGDAAPVAKDKHGAAPAVMLLWGACQPMRFARTRLADLEARGGRQDFGRIAQEQIASW